MRLSRNRPADDRAEVRVSDAERDQAVGELRDRYAEGRLSQETFLYRMDAALRAKARSDLSPLFDDLPATGHPLPGSGRRVRTGRAAGQRISAPLTLALRRAADRRRARRPAGGEQLSWTQAESRPLRLPPPSGERFTIGRAADCDFTVADQSVSRWHARLDRQDDGWLLFDLGSTNGTRLNGWRVTTEVPVRAGDQVTFGSVTFVVTDRAMSTTPD